MQERFDGINGAAGKYADGVGFFVTGGSGGVGQRLLVPALERHQRQGVCDYIGSGLMALSIG